MKSVRFLLLAAITVLLQITVSAEHVSADKALQVGKNFMMKDKTAVEMTQITDKSVENQHFYVFNLNDKQGWVIVADDDRSTPILGYSDSGSFVMENMPENIEDWLVGISSEIQYIIDNEFVTEENTQQWDELIAGIVTEKGGNAVSPLVTTRWDQDPYYNNLCPYSYIYGQRTVTGCVATAMAQVVNFYQHPAIGTGSHSYSTSSYGSLYANFGATRYDWNNMPTQLTSSSSSTQVNAVATLMYHLGVSVEMDYGVGATGGSGAYVISSYTNGEHCAEYALKHYFGYKSTAHGEMKDNYSASTWKSMVRAELDARRPLIYAGFGNGGHCFVCDGYDNNDKFHFNWGWSGQNDGYFSLSALNPGSGGAGGGSYSFTSNQQAIFNLQPDGSQPGPGTANSIQLYSGINVASEIQYGGEIAVSVTIANYTDSNFSGYIGAEAFDTAGDAVSFIGSSSASISTNSTKTFNFTTTNNPLYLPGRYQVKIFYKTQNGGWTIVDGGSYPNDVSFNVVHSDALETYSDINITTDNGRLIQGNIANINVDIKNTGAETFNGQFKASLANLEGVVVQDIGVKNVNGMGPNYHYTNGANFVGEITVEPGTYHLELAYKANGASGWSLLGASFFQNPSKVVVESPASVPDRYENNDTQAQARPLPLGTWTNHQTTVLTTGSNLHVGNDIDYYSIELPTGYHYVIRPRLHDAGNSGNGHTYTVDATFAYSTDGVTYSQSINDVMTSTIAFNGGTIYFVINPCFTGMAGTYLLDILIEGDGDIGVDEEYALNVVLYPNPVNDMLHLACENMTRYDIYSYDGRLINSAQTTDNEVVIDFSDFDSGAYLLKITTEEGTFTRRVIKK
ncbi:MAG: thiol protease/hemagglutinin PrtT [Bacteroidales bacterium]|nr:thiol protease/hemagglutinin PrtT [Bacteroidales bacterium]